MSRVLRADESVSSERLGTTLARLWTINGLSLELVDVVDVCGGIRDSDLCICSFTTERPANPGMTDDGHVYSIGYITEWLNKNDTSPNTNLILKNNCVIRLLSLKDVIKHFLFKRHGHRGAARAQSEISSRRVVEGAAQYSQMQAELEKLSSYIANDELEIAGWISHLATMRSIRQRLEEFVRLHRDKSATHIQAT